MVSTVGKVTGFKQYTRREVPYRVPLERILDFAEIYAPHDEESLAKQGARCMDCGIPFCQQSAPKDHRNYLGGCPIHNLIPEWNDLVYRHHWKDALDRLHATNNFPEFTGRVCPAPCEGSCVLGITDPPVAIKNIEMAIVDKGFDEGWITPSPPKKRTGKLVFVVGSGPAGLAAADMLNRVGHQVTVYERADRIGGLLMYGIPNMKLDKKEVVERRIDILRQEGIVFKTRVDVGDGFNGSKSVEDLVKNCDALLLATGATLPNDLSIPGRDLEGVMFAMDFLTTNTKSLLDSNFQDGNFTSAENLDVIVIGSGDTGTDCIGTAVRHGCSSLINLELFPPRPLERTQNNPWPEYPQIYSIDYGHREATSKFGNDPRHFLVATTEFIDSEEGRVSGLKTENVVFNEGKFDPIRGTEKIWKAGLVLLALGFEGPEHYVSEPLKLEYDERSNYLANKGSYLTNRGEIFAAGDCRSGQSLVVRAINEGREAAREIDHYLMGSTSLVG